MVEVPASQSSVNNVAVLACDVWCIATVAQGKVCVTFWKGIYVESRLGVSYVGIDFGYDRYLWIHLCGDLAHEGVLRHGVAQLGVGISKIYEVVNNYTQAVGVSAVSVDGYIVAVVFALGA